MSDCLKAKWRVSLDCDEQAFTSWYLVEWQGQDEVWREVPGLGALTSSLAHHIVADHNCHTPPALEEAEARVAELEAENSDLRSALHTHEVQHSGWLRGDPR